MPSISFAPVASVDPGGTYEITGQTQGIAAGSTLILKALSEIDPTDIAESGIGAPKVQDDGSFSLTDIALNPQSFITASYTDPTSRQTTTSQAPFSLDGFLHHEDVYSPSGTFLYEATLLDHGAGTRVDVAGGGETVQSFFDDAIHNGGAPNNTFVFAPGHGRHVVGLFRVGGADHDRLSFAGSDFGGSVAAVLRDTHNAKGGAVITDPTTGDIVKLQGITKAQLAHHAADIAFQP